MTELPFGRGARPTQPAVILAPMAGITNGAFRQLCRELAGAQGAALYVSEMVTSRALLEGSAQSLRLIAPAPGERPHSVQLYGVDPATIGAAVRLVIDRGETDHIDLNFGCPVPKVTRKGGGSALPWKLSLFRAIIRSAVSAAEPAGIPVTVKMRKGIDEDHLTYLTAGRIAQDEGVAGIALHARTAVQFYSGTADWSAIARLKAEVTEIPVYGNGDIWSAEHAREMVQQTGCDGVVVGRGCLGRPWLFAELGAAFSVPLPDEEILPAGVPRLGQPGVARPKLSWVAGVLRRHVDLLTEHFAPYCDDAEQRACRDIRKHIAWYLKGFSVPHQLRSGLALVSSTAELDDLLGQLPDQDWPGAIAEGQRGRAGTARARVHLPEGWLLSQDLNEEQAKAVQQAELSFSGG